MENSCVQSKGSRITLALCYKELSWMHLYIDELTSEILLYLCDVKRYDQFVNQRSVSISSSLRIGRMILRGGNYKCSLVDEVRWLLWVLSGNDDENCAFKTRFLLVRLLALGEWWWWESLDFLGRNKSLRAPKTTTQCTATKEQPHHESRKRQLFVHLSPTSLCDIAIIPNDRMQSQHGYWWVITD